MGKLIKNHWARLLILTASTYQLLAALSAFFWPKLFFDFLTTTLDPAVRPVPILQLINLVLGLLALAWEWPAPLFVAAASKSARRSGGGGGGGGGDRCGRGRDRGRGGTAKGDGDPRGCVQEIAQQKQKQGLHAAVTAAAVQMDADAAAVGQEERNEGKRSRGGGAMAAMLAAMLAGMHRSIEARLMVYPLSSLASLLLYQGTNAGLYYIIGMGVYFWAFCEGEVVMPVPWTLPKRRKGVGMV